MSMGIVTWPIRLRPGDDLRRPIEERVHSQGGKAAFVVGGIGSLGTTRIRLAGADEPVGIDGDVENELVVRPSTVQAT